MLLRFFAMVMILLLSPLALADGLIIIHNPPTTIPGHFPFAPLEISYHRVDVKIEDNLATTTVDQEFRNPSGARLEGTYLFPLPEGAHIDQFAMDVNGTMQDAELLDAAKARSLYEEIVRKQKDPALLEYVGRGAFKARIFPIEPHSKKQIKIRYTQLIKSDNALSEYVYPLNTEKFSSRPLEEVAIKVRLKTAEPLKTIYCPSHEVEIKRNDSSTATVGYEAKNVRPDTDFRLVFTQAARPVDLRLLTYAKRGEDGYFLLMASPGIDVPQELVQPRDLCFVVDTSGSMSGEKLKQAKEALSYCIENLNPEDRFQVVRFSTEAQPLWGELMKATPTARQKATAFVETFKANGGTAIDDALKEALKLEPRSSERPYVVIFLTDGQPTVGETSEDKLVRMAEKQEKTRIFCFGIGDDINTHLLDKLAQNSNAFTTYVGAKEDLEVKVSNFYAGIQAPVLTDVALSLSGTEGRFYEVMPKIIPDLFKGQTAYIVGRYQGSGPASVKLTGKLNGQSRSFAQDVDLSADRARHEYVAQLWATRRVGFLLDEIRLRGESTELREEVTRLAREFGIVTPYTSYLILEDERRRGVPEPLQSLRELSHDRERREAVSGFYESNRADSSVAAKAGPRGVTNAQSMQNLKEATVAQPAMAPAAADAMTRSAGQMQAGGAQGYRNAANYAQQARVVSGRAFYQNNNTWTDATAQNHKRLKTQQVRFGSDEYFALANRSKDIATWLSLGPEVDVVVDGTLYQVRN